MNDQAGTIDQADEDILSCQVSDEALEAVANAEKWGTTLSTTPCDCFGEPAASVAAGRRLGSAE